MNLSYWELDTWFTDVDYTVVGSGIVGLNCALRLRENFPKAKIIILEKGNMPSGASTKNAGFACFGSISEILDDLKTHTEKEVFDLVKQRKNGLDRLRDLVGDEHLDYKELGGYELFTKSDNALYRQCVDQIPFINNLLRPLFNEDVYRLESNRFGFENVQSEVILNKFEGQIDTGKMMRHLLHKAHGSNIAILNTFTVLDYIDNRNGVEVMLEKNSFQTKKLFIATNGFANQLGIEKVKPARAQVLITHPIKDLKIKGTFHLDQGYYYFRNINDRILLGGGRNLDFSTEETSDFGETELIQKELERLLREVILPSTPFKIDHRWSGIMGIGDKKKPIVEKISDHTYCGVRLGGMGVAIGSSVGKELADLAD